MNGKFNRPAMLLLASLIVGSASHSTYAQEAQSCQYQIYSKIMDRAFAVCETNIGKSACEGRSSSDKTLAARKTNKARIMGTPTYSDRACPIEKAVGVCSIASRTMYFLGGPIDKLEFGCQRMQGTWQTLKS